MVGRTLYVIVIGIAIIAFIGCGKDKEKEAKSIVSVVEEMQKSIPDEVSKKEIEEPSKIAEQKSPLPKYTVLDEDIYDAPVKTQVTLELLISKDISKEGLMALLKHLYEKNRQRSGFKYHKHPTNIFIYAYPSKEHADSGMGQWVGMLAKAYDDVEPEITINEEFLTQLKKKPEEKLGLTETKRRSIFAEIIKVAHRANKEADRKYPDLKPGHSRTAGLAQMKRWASFNNELVDKYENELAEKYSLTREQFDEIGLEGAVKSWPKPKS